MEGCIDWGCLLYTSDAADEWEGASVGVRRKYDLRSAPPSKAGLDNFLRGVEGKLTAQCFSEIMEGKHFDVFWATLCDVWDLQCYKNVDVRNKNAIIDAVRRYADEHGLQYASKADEEFAQVLANRDFVKWLIENGVFVLNNGYLELAPHCYNHFINYCVAELRGKLRTHTYMSVLNEATYERIAYNGDRRVGVARFEIGFANGSKFEVTSLGEALPHEKEGIEESRALLRVAKFAYPSLLEFFNKSYRV